MNKLLTSLNSYIIKPFFTQYTAGSVGRILLATTYFTALFRFWLLEKDPPSTMIEVLFACMAYVFGNKILDYKKGTPAQVSTTAGSQEESKAPTQE